MLPWQILKVETKICANRGILEVNLKKSGALKFIMNISFVPSICIHRSIILILIERSTLVYFFPPWNSFFPQFFIFISSKILVSAMNSSLCKVDMWQVKADHLLQVSKVRGSIEGSQPEWCISSMIYSGGHHTGWKLSVLTHQLKNSSANAVFNGR